MPVNPAPQQIRQRLSDFVAFRREHLTGDEKGQAQVFLDRLFKALGHEGVFEAGATLEMRVARRSGGGTAFADLVWKPRVLVEMKKTGEDLRRHYQQAFEYWIDLVPDRPAYVILCNFDELWVYDLNRQLDEPIDRITLEDLPRRWEAVGFLLPIEEEPTFQNDLVAVTREAAATVARVFNHLVDRNIARDKAQRFILQCVMAMFAEDVGLLPSHLFGKAIEDSMEGGNAYDLVFGLFREMNTTGTTQGGRYAGTPYFNGGLFTRVEPFELTVEEIHAIHTAAQEDWVAVRPEIFGTLFEQSLDRSERHAYGAHFTSELDIQKIVLPTIVRPWRERIASASSVKDFDLLEQDLLAYRVLDPACGCGNFLYIAYRELRRIGHAIAEERSSRQPVTGGQRTINFVSPRQCFGIDVNSFAVEIAKLTLMLGRKLATDELGEQLEVLPLDDLDSNFIAADALGVEWPAFDVCIGNPPYLGRRRVVQERGADYASWLAENYPEVGGVSDYVVYWFRKAHDLLPQGASAGLVGTNSIRESESRVASLDYIVDNGGEIFEAISTQPWSGDAQVNVSIVNWIKGSLPGKKTLWLADATLKRLVDHIPSSLSVEVDVRHAAKLKANSTPKRCFQGQTPGNVDGFVLTAAQAADLRMRDGDTGVIRPFFLGDELNHSGRPERFVIDFPHAESVLAEAAAPAAFDRVRQLVMPDRQTRADSEAEANRVALERNPKANVNWHHRNFLARWWQLSYRRNDLLGAIEPLSRYIALARYAVQDRISIYAFVDPSIRPSDQLQVFAFEDDYSFGILQSSVHRRWFEVRCSTLGQALRYTSRTVFETFPWPQDPSDTAVNAIVDVVEELLALRASRTKQGITLGQQYDSIRDPGTSPLRTLHERLDAAVLDAYDFDKADELVAQLLTLNEGVADDEKAKRSVRRPGNAGLDGTLRTTDAIAL